MGRSSRIGLSLDRALEGPFIALLEGVCFCTARVGLWPIAPGDILTARQRLRGVADMNHFRCAAIRSE